MIKRRLEIMDKCIELFLDYHNTPINGFRRGRGSGSSQGKERPGNGVKTVLMLCPPTCAQKGERNCFQTICLRPEPPP